MPLHELAPSLALTPLRQLHPDLVQEHEDWEVLQKLKARGGVDGFITLDANMLQLAKEMVVLHQTRLTLIVIEDTDNDPIAAWAVLLIHATQLAKQLSRRRPQLWRLRRPTHPRPTNPYDELTRLAERAGASESALMAQHRLSAKQLHEL
jgi:hypothetical protein